MLIIGSLPTQGTLSYLGGAVATVTDAVISQAGAAGRTLGAPSLAELDRYGRAVVAKGHRSNCSAEKWFGGYLVRLHEPISFLYGIDRSVGSSHCHDC